MAYGNYGQSNLILAGDYNAIVGSNPSTPSGGNYPVNAVWGTGYGDAGYGQTALTTVSQAGLITAGQWATMLQTLDACYKQQTGSATGVSYPTSGGTVAYNPSLAGYLSTAYSNRLLYNGTNGSTSTTATGSTQSYALSAAATNAAVAFSFTRTITFSSADAARYFFNAGGGITFTSVSFTSSNGTGRTNDLQTLMGTYLGNFQAIRAYTNTGRSGTGGTPTLSTSYGYWNAGTGSASAGSGAQVAKIQSTNYPYSGDYIQLNIATNGVKGSNGDVGNVLYLNFYIYSGALQGTTSDPDHAIGVTWNHRIDAIQPNNAFLPTQYGASYITIS